MPWLPSIFSVPLFTEYAVSGTQVEKVNKPDQYISVTLAKHTPRRPTNAFARSSSSRIKAGTGYHSTQSDLRDLSDDL